MNTPDGDNLTPTQAERLTAPTEPWLSCDDCFDRIDTYIDRVAHDSHGLDEPLRVHLTNCPACHEEAESLITLTAEDDGADAETLLAAFHADLQPHDQLTPQRRKWTSRLRRR